MSVYQAPTDSRCEVGARADGAICVTLSGELDLALSSVARPALERAQSQAALVIADLAAVDFMDSTGIHLLVEADARARRDGTRLVVARPPAVVRRLFDLTGTRDQLIIEEGPPPDFPGSLA